jgi:NTE family protein
MSEMGHAETSAQVVAGSAHLPIGRQLPYHPTAEIPFRRQPLLVLRRSAMARSRKPVIGIALGSGVGRGWAHLGVLSVLEASGLKPDIICGTSIGALVGGACVGGRMTELEDWARGLTKGRMTRLFDFQLSASGVIAGRRVTQILHPDLHALSIEKLDRPFVAVATDLSTGQEVWLRQGNLVEAIRASYAVPGLFPPVQHDGRWLIDGALVNPVPVSVCRALGADVTIAVSLNMDYLGESPQEDDEALEMIEYERPDKSERAGLSMGSMRRFFGRRRADPSLFTVVARALTIVQDRIARSRLAGDPPDILIAPKVGDVGLFEFYRAAESILAGENAAKSSLSEIRAAVQRRAGGADPGVRSEQARGAVRGGAAPA